MSTPQPRTDPHREVGAALRRWATDGVGVVRLLERHGFGTVEPGQLLVGTANGGTAGVLLNGTVDGAAVPLAASAAHAPGTADAQVGEHPAVDAGLACAGGARLLGHPLPAEQAEALGAALEQGVPAALAATADGTACLVLTGAEVGERHGSLGSPALDDALAAAAAGLVRRGATVTERVQLDGVETLLDVWVPVPAVLVVGAGAIGVALLAQVDLLGWAGRPVTGLGEARTALESFTDADVLVLLDHAPEFDTLLVDGLRRGRGFLGALGSRHTQAERRGRLLAAGLAEDELARLHGPVGLDVGARTPAESAVSIVAEVIATRSGRGAQPLAAAAGRIGA